VVRLEDEAVVTDRDSDHLDGGAHTHPTRTIVHLSDLHFGRVDRAIVAALLGDVERQRPDLVVVSGDLTQRARKAQFAAARRFIDRLPSPKLIVAGNHDVPLYDVVRRFLSPLGRYRRMLTGDLTPTYVDDALAVRGINTARATAIDGRVAHEDIDAAGRWFASVGDARLRVLVAHHPFAPVAAGGPVVGRSVMALEAAAAAAVDLILGGHVHVGAAPDALVHDPELRRRIVLLTAGTATSTRRRGEPNSYNVVRYDAPDRLSASVRTWTASAFADRTARAWVRTADGWWAG
jgi:3',5'-cyclic AMP phosphodiesterase CpdA